MPKLPNHRKKDTKSKTKPKDAMEFIQNEPDVQGLHSFDGVHQRIDGVSTMYKHVFAFAWRMLALFHSNWISSRESLKHVFIAIIIV